jgi:hypothetical protein
VGLEASEWLAFGGVLAGAAVGYASSAVQEAARRRHERRQADEQAEREDRIRFEDRRFDAYVSMITAANRVYAAVKHPLTAEAAGYTSALHSAYEQYRTSLSPAFLLATSVATRDRFAELASVTAALRRDAEARGGPVAEDDPDLRPLFRAQRRAVKAAEAAMRDEFGLERLLPRFPSREDPQASTSPASPEPDLSLPGSASSAGGTSTEATATSERSPRVAP